jgi:hypothetical protein
MSRFTPQAEPELGTAFDTTLPDRSSAGNHRFVRTAYAGQMDFWKPAYDRKTRAATVFRPYPARSYTDPDNSFCPYRVDPGGKDRWGYWLRRYDCAWSVGEPAISLIINDPGKSVLDNRMNPLGLLYSAVANAVEAATGNASRQAMFSSQFTPQSADILRWAGHVKGRPGKGALLDRPQTIAFMQGCLLVHGGQNMFQSPDKPMPGWGRGPGCLFGLTLGAARDLFTKLNETTPNYRGDPADFNARFKYGDPVDLAAGRFIVVQPMGGAQGGPTADPFTTAPAGSQAPTGQREKVGFTVDIVPDYNGIPAALPAPEHRAMIRDKWVHFDELMYTPGYVEQAHLLCQVMPADILVYAWGDAHPDWITEDKWREFKQVFGGRQAAAGAGYHPPVGVPQSLAHGQTPGGPYPTQPAAWPAHGPAPSAATAAPPPVGVPPFGAPGGQPPVTGNPPAAAPALPQIPGSPPPPPGWGANLPPADTALAAPPASPFAAGPPVAPPPGASPFDSFQPGAITPPADYQAPPPPAEPNVPKG